MGSGVYLKRAQKKYCIEHFTKEILEILDTEEKMFQRERELVEICESSYNLMEGGRGGWTYARSKIKEETYRKISKTLSEKEYSEEYIEKMREHCKKNLHHPAVQKRTGSTIKK